MAAPRREAVPPFAAWLSRVTPSYRWDWPYLRLVQRHLDRVTRQEIDRLAVFLPPRHGKSELTTVRYPVWRLAREPARRVVVAGYSQTFAEKFSRKMRRVGAGWLALSRERNSAMEWETAAGASAAWRRPRPGGGDEAV